MNVERTRLNSVYWMTIDLSSIQSDENLHANRISEWIENTSVCTNVTACLKEMTIAVKTGKPFNSIIL